MLEQLAAIHGVGVRDVLEIGIVSYAIYRVLLILHRTRAMQILVGLVVVVVLYALARALKLSLILNIIGYLSPFAAIALVVVFAPEIRAMFAQLGRSPGSRFFTHLEPVAVTGQITEAVERLSRAGIGALIAVEREEPLEEYVASGSPLQAKVSCELLTTIFTPNTPLHDGAVIVRGDTIVAAGCILPLSQAALHERRIGTRHRAALGLAENSDAVIIAVSEETSAISVAAGGRIWHNLTSPQVRDLLNGRVPRELPDHAGATVDG